MDLSIGDRVFTGCVIAYGASIGRHRGLRRCGRLTFDTTRGNGVSVTGTTVHKSGITRVDGLVSGCRGVRHRRRLSIRHISRRARRLHRRFRLTGVSEGTRRSERAVEIRGCLSNRVRTVGTGTGVVDFSGNLDSTRGDRTRRHVRGTELGLRHDGLDLSTRGASIRTRLGRGRLTIGLGRDSSGIGVTGAGGGHCSDGDGWSTMLLGFIRGETKLTYRDEFDPFSFLFASRRPFWTRFGRFVRFIVSWSL